LSRTKTENFSDESLPHVKIDLLIKRVKRLDQMINSMVEYSQIGRITRPDELVHLDPLVRNVVARLIFPEHLRMIIPRALPVVRCHHDYVQKVFQHLLQNAATFMDKTEGVIIIAWADEGAHWKFSVTDNGPGIDSKYHKKIFQIFQTLEPRDVSERLGIGLALVKKIVEFYGGTIGVKSEVRKGSTFYFTWPKRT